MSFLDNVRHAPDIVFNYDCKVTSKLDMVVISVWGPLTRTNLFPQWKWAEKLWGYYKKFIIVGSTMNVPIIDAVSKINETAINCLFSILLPINNSINHKKKEQGTNRYAFASM